METRYGGLQRPCTYDNRLHKIMSFFMRSLLRTVPLIGALLISAAPVQAFETFEELNKACSASEENTTLCKGAAEPAQ